MSSEEEPIITLKAPGSTAKLFDWTSQNASCEAGNVMQMSRFPRLQRDTFEGAEALDGLHYFAVLLVGVDLDDIRAGTISHILDIECDFDLILRRDRRGGELQVAVLETRIAETVAKRVERQPLVIEIGIAFRNVVLIRWRHAVETCVDGVGQK